MLIQVKKLRGCCGEKLPTQLRIFFNADCKATMFMRRQQKWIANVRFIKLQEVNGFVAYGTVLTVIV